MFSKPFNVTGVQHLRKDIKRALDKLIEQSSESSRSYFGDTLTTQQIHSALSQSSNAQISVGKCKRNGKGMGVKIYFVDREPLFFKLEKCECIFPTVYTLWKIPNLISCFEIEGPTSKFIMRGANLMARGVLKHDSYPPCLYEIEPRGVKTRNCRYAFAVGSVTAETDSILKAEGAYGIAMKTVHVVGDYLWLMGSQSVPDKSFTISLTDLSEAPTEICESSNKTTVSIDSEPDDENHISENSNDENDDAEHLSDHQFVNSDLQSEIDDSINVESKEVDIPKLNPDIVDTFLQYGIIGALHGVADDDLPKSISAVYSMALSNFEFMMANNLKCAELNLDDETLQLMTKYPPKKLLNVKNSTHRKVLYLFQWAEIEGLIDLKLTARRGGCLISRIYTKHPFYRQCRTLYKCESDKGSKCGRRVIDYFSFSAPFTQLLKEEDIRKDKLPKTEVLTILAEYISTNKLKTKVINRKSTAVKQTLLDNFLSSLFGRSGYIDDDELEELLLSNLTNYYVIVDPGVDIVLQQIQIKKGTPPAVLVEEKKAPRAGCFFITCISRYEFYKITSASLKHCLSKLIAAGSTVKCQTLKADLVEHETIILQGKCGRNVTKYLDEKYGLDRKHVKLMLMEPKKPKTQKTQKRQNK